MTVARISQRTSAQVPCERLLRADVAELGGHFAVYLADPWLGCGAPGPRTTWPPPGPASPPCPGQCSGGALSGAASPGGVLQAGDPRVPLSGVRHPGCHTPSSWPGLSRGDLSLSHSPPWLPWPSSGQTPMAAWRHLLQEGPLRQALHLGPGSHLAPFPHRWHRPHVEVGGARGPARPSGSREPGGAHTPGRPGCVWPGASRGAVVRGSGSHSSHGRVF